MADPIGTGPVVGSGAQSHMLQMTVAIDALPLPTPETLGMPVTNQPFLEAYGEGDQYLGKVLYPIAYGSPGYGSWQTLTFSSPTANIRSVRFSSQYFCHLRSMAVKL